MWCSTDDFIIPLIAQEHIEHNSLMFSNAQTRTKKHYPLSFKPHYSNFVAYLRQADMTRISIHIVVKSLDGEFRKSRSFRNLELARSRCFMNVPQSEWHSANGTLYISSTWNIQDSVIGRHKIQIPFELLEIVHLLFGT